MARCTDFPVLRRRHALSLGLLPAALLAVAGCGHSEGAAHQSAAEKTPRLEVVRASRTMLTRRIELTATVEPMEKADLCARVPGVVDYLPADIDIGRRVRGPHDGKPAEKLVQLAVPDLEAQKQHKEALLEQAKAQQKQAIKAQAVASRELAEAEKQERRYAAEHAYLKIAHERVTELVRRGAQQPERSQETEKQLESAVAAWDAARAQIETRQAKVRSAEADLKVAAARVVVAEAEVRNLVELLKLATLTAPFDGVITRRWVDRGATIKDPGTPLLTVMRTDWVRVLLDVPARDAPLMNATEGNPNPGGKGDSVIVRFPALKEAGRESEYSGEITRMAEALDPNTRTMRAEVHLDNKDGRLRPGMYGVASLLLEEHYGALTIPATALVRRGDQLIVFQVADVSGDPPRGVVQAVEGLVLGLDDGRRVEVCRGLTGKELLIARGNGVVRDGETVIAVPAREK
jgi:HlyD family secretion protein